MTPRNPYEALSKILNIGVGRPRAKGFKSAKINIYDPRTKGGARNKGYCEGITKGYRIWRQTARQRAACAG